MSPKKFIKVKEDDGAVRDINEDKVLFEISNEDIMLVAKTTVALSQANILNISLLNERITEEESRKKETLGWDRLFEDRDGEKETSGWSFDST